MRESTLIAQLLTRLEQAGRAAGAARVSAVRLRIGECAGIEPERLIQTFNTRSLGTIAQGAILSIEWVSLQARCDACGGRFRIVRYQFVCPGCGSQRVRVIAGEEFVLESLTVVTEYEGTLTRWH